MKLKRLKVTNFVGIPEADVTFERPVALFAGQNGQGKSSIRDAVEFALTAKCRAMRFKNETSHISRGDGMLVEQWYENSDSETLIAKRSKGSGSAPDDRKVLRYCLNPGEFIALPAKQRADVLSETLGGGLNEVIQQAMHEHVDPVDNTVLAELQGSGVNLLDVDAFRKQVVEQRRQYKRDIETLPDKAPLLGDYELEEGYDVNKDKDLVTEDGQRIANGTQMLADARSIIRTNGEISDLQKQIKRLEGEKQQVPRLPRGVSQEKLNITPVYLTIQEDLLKENDEANCTCPICKHISARPALEHHHDELAEWYDKYREPMAERTWTQSENERLDREVKIQQRLLETAQSQLNELKQRVTDEDMQKLAASGERQLAELQSERDAAQARIANHQRFSEATEAFTTAGKRRQQLLALVTECNRIDQSLADGGPVKAAIAAGGRQMPINKSLLAVWNMQELTCADNGEIALRGLPIEYCSKSERARAACVMGLALAEVSEIGIAAIDDEFDCLDEPNRRAFFEAVTECRLNNVLVCCSTEKDYANVTMPDWLDVWAVRAGKVTRVA